MLKNYRRRLAYRQWPTAALVLAATSPALAQTPVWKLAQAGETTQTGSTSQTLATTADANGNVLVVGYFTGQLTLGSTTLTSVGDQDLFVAKWVPATSTWAWAQRGGGTGADQAQSIAVSNGSVYVTGYLTNTTTNAATVTLGTTNTAGTTTGTTVAGASTTSSTDLFVAKYTDNGSRATLGWAQVAGGTEADRGSAVAVSGTNVYVTGAITNNRANANAVVFGTGTPQNGASAGTTGTLDLVLAKYTDGGNSATFGWSQVGGGTAADEGHGLAVNGTALYVTGYLTNDDNTANTNAVFFGGAGTTAGTQPQLGANPNGTPSNDLVVARYTDNGTTGSFKWSHVAGGNNLDQGFGVAVNGSNIYVTGAVTNSFGNTTKVVFGGTGTTISTIYQSGATTTNTADLVVAKYTEASNGGSATFGWSQVGGGNTNDPSQPLSDAGLAIAVSGTSVYVTGALTNSSTNTTGVFFGGSGTTKGTASQNGASSTSSKDVMAAKYTDNGTTATLNWTQVGGGSAAEQGQGLALVNNEVYLVGNVVPTATFGSLTISSPAGSNTLFLGRLADVPLPVTLTSFTATRPADRAAVDIAWATASETNSAHFEVERSPDGVRFAAIGTVAAAGTTAATHAYGFLDAALPAGATVLYYRLRQVDLDGTATYSPVRAVALAALGLTLFPNPAAHQATLSGAGAGQQVQVYDAVGRLVLAAPADAAGTAGLELPASLPGGVYVVRIGQQALRLAVE